MSTALPPIPDRQLLADVSQETAANEQVQPEMVEKDFYLTRLLWALHGELGAKALLKGGTLLSKVDLGFFRMSEDVDLVVPGEVRRFGKGANANRLNVVRNALKRVVTAVGLSLPFPSGTTYENGSHGVWELPYPSEFGTQKILLEASIRPTLRPAREVALRQMLAHPSLGAISAARCWALDEDEARAEKVRAACTREAIRDYYDLERLLSAGKDFTSAGFIALVDAKLAEMHAPALRTLTPPPFGLTAVRRQKLDAGLRTTLPMVLRTNAPAFDMNSMLKRFEELWAP